MAIWRELFRRDRGQSAVEFALVSPMLFLILLGLFDLGRAVYYYNSLSHIAREGTRAGIVLQYQPQWQILGNTPGFASPKVYSDISSYAGTDTIVGRIAKEATMFDLSKMTVSMQAPKWTLRYESSPLTVKVQYPFELLVTKWLPHPPSILLQAQTTMIIE